MVETSLPMYFKSTVAISVVAIASQLQVVDAWAYGIGVADNTICDNFANCITNFLALCNTDVFDSCGNCGVNSLGIDYNTDITDPQGYGNDNCDGFCIIYNSGGLTPDQLEAELPEGAAAGTLTVVETGVILNCMVERGTGCSSWAPTSNWVSHVYVVCDPGIAGPSPDPPSGPSGPLKFMVVGDSISHGMEADWTWRWHVHEWLTAHGYDAKFVGPWKGTHGPAPREQAKPQPPLLSGETGVVSNPEVVGSYASGVSDLFRDSGHASLWGRQTVQSKDTIHDWVATYQPDYLLILLGFNDLGWLFSSPEALVGTMGGLIENAREAKADVKILMGNVVQRSFLGGRQDLVDSTNAYNALLRSTYTNWFRWESPCAYVDVQSNYNCQPSGCPDGHDGLHPNALGEYHIAEAFVRVLKKDLGFVGDDFIVPGTVPRRTISTPTNVAIVAVPEGLYTSWDMVETSRGYEIRSRLQGMTTWWFEGGVYPATTASWLTWLLDGQTWEVQVRTAGDNDDRSEWSPLIAATADLQTAPGPPNIVCIPSGDGIQITWGDVSGYNVNRYAVIVWDLDTEGAYIDIYGVRGISYFVGGLLRAHRYGIWVSTWVTLPSGIAGGLPAAGTEVIVGVGAPAPPASISVQNIDPTTVRLSWPASQNAAGYKIYGRSVKDNTAFDEGNPTTETTHDVAWLYPGTWNFQFCVSAYNGNLESAHTACVIPPVYPGFRRRDEILANYTLVTNTSTVYNTTEMKVDTKLQELYKRIYENISDIRI